MAEIARAFLLAAGFGTRLRPLTEELPKPAWPLFDVPLAAHVLRLLHGTGVREAVVNLHYLPDAMKEALIPWIPEGFLVHWSFEPEILGTGGALEGWRDFLGKGPFFLANGDTYQELDLGAMADFHRAKGALGTLSLRRLPSGAKGPIEVDGAGRIVRFLSARAPGGGEGQPCDFTGVHCLEPGVLADLPGGPCCINAQVHARLVERGEPLFGFLVPEGAFWSDLGTPERYLGAHRELLGAGRVPPGCPGEVVLGRTRTGDGGEIIGPAYRGPGARVLEGARVGPLSVLGSGTTVGAGAVVQESVLWGCAKVVPGRVVRGVVLSSSGRTLSVPTGGG